MPAVTPITSQLPGRNTGAKTPLLFSPASPTITHIPAIISALWLLLVSAGEYLAVLAPLGRELGRLWLLILPDGECLGQEFQGANKHALLFGCQRRQHRAHLATAGLQMLFGNHPGAWGEPDMHHAAILGVAQPLHHAALLQLIHQPGDGRSGHFQPLGQIAHRLRAMNRQIHYQLDLRIRDVLWLTPYQDARALYRPCPLLTAWRGRHRLISLDEMVVQMMTRLEGEQGARQFWQNGKRLVHRLLLNIHRKPPRHCQVLQYPSAKIIGGRASPVKAGGEDRMVLRLTRAQISGIL